MQIMHIEKPLCCIEQTRTQFDGSLNDAVQTDNDDITGQSEQIKLG